MLTKTEKNFTYLFAFIVLAELACIGIESLSSFRYATKPAIVTSLLVFFWNGSKQITAKVRTLTLMALILSLAGDVFLMLEHRTPKFFMLGLGSFLLAHAAYTVMFLQKRDKAKKGRWFVLGLIVYATILVQFIIDGIGKLLFPVMIYIAAILLMATTAFLRSGGPSSIGYRFVIFGAMFFVVSDSLLALDKFWSAFPFAGILVMTTYSLAQYCIVMGIKKTL